MTKIELRRKRKAARDDVEGEGNRHSMARLDVESTSASTSFGDRPTVEERFKRGEDSQQCEYNVVYAHAYVIMEHPRSVPY